MRHAKAQNDISEVAVLGMQEGFRAAVLTKSLLLRPVAHMATVRHLRQFHHVPFCGSSAGRVSSGTRTMSSLLGFMLPASRWLYRHVTTDGLYVSPRGQKPALGKDNGGPLSMKEDYGVL